MNRSTGNRYRVAVDIGGTFTDFILLDRTTGAIVVGKTLTTPADPSIAVREGLVDLLERSRVTAGELETLIHGTTIVINSIIERKGARTALVTTRGFRDVLELRRERRYDIWDLAIELVRPLVPRRWRYEVAERVRADGQVLTPFDERGATELAARLREENFESAAVCFLHAYSHPDHERRMAAILASEAPVLSVSISSDVLPQLREYERSYATVLNAYTRPTTERYLAHLDSGLAEMGFRGNWYVMASNAGIVTPETAGRYPVRIVESGPVGGVLAAAYFCHGSLLSFDMGGTTAKACLVVDGRPSVTNEYEVARVRRFKKGSGIPLHLPVVDLIEIGAGGGSIAHLDEFGLISVGPESAGADPGPVCYARGGTQPTVTDANLILGYLDAGYFLGGTMRLDKDAAEASLGELGRGVGMTAVQAAWGVHEIVTTNMAEAVRTHAIERGVDYRKLSLVAFGGAGPAHAYRIAKMLDMRTVIFPRAAGAFSALGFLTAPLRFDFVHTSVARLDALEPEQVHGVFRRMEEQAAGIFAQAGLPMANVTLERTVRMRYAGQGFEVTVPLPEGFLESGNKALLVAAFEEAYLELYSRSVPGAAIEVVTWSCVASGPPPHLQVAPSEASQGDPRKGRRPVYSPDTGGFTSCDVYDRYRLRPGDEVRGPAVVEERECTIFVGPGALARIDDMYNLVMRMGGE